MPSKLSRRARRDATATRVRDTIRAIGELRDLGDTFEKLAEEFGVSTRTVYRWNAGTSVPHPRELVKLLGRLEIMRNATNKGAT